VSRLATLAGLAAAARSLPGLDDRIAGASIDQQLIEAGLADELRIDLIPVLHGGGVRLFGELIGYESAYTKNPTYEEVCSGRTEPAEAVRVVFDPKQVSYADC
jgi:dihydrofolate reductase